MNLEQIFCPNLACQARGQCGRGNISVHSLKEKRCHCSICKKTFSVSKGTIFYRLKTEPQTVILVLLLLAYGCPVQAIVVAFGFDERTVKAWWRRAGQHCQEVHEHMVGRSQLDLLQVQADEIKVKIVGGVIWMAMAMMVPTRLWLGGVISHRRDQALIQRLATAQIWSAAVVGGGWFDQLCQCLSTGLSQSYPALGATRSLSTASLVGDCDRPGG